MVVAASGTQSAAINTEHTLATEAGVAVYELWVDVSAMLTGDTLELRIYAKIFGADAYQVCAFESRSGAQGADNALAFSIPIPADAGIKVTLKQTAGTGRDYKWKLLSL